MGCPDPAITSFITITTKSRDVAYALATTRTNVVVLMVCANWNQLCEIMMKPFWDMAMDKRKEAVFCRVDVDKCKGVAEWFRVEALPTFLLIKDSKENARVVGAKVEELNTTIKGNI